MLALCCKSTSLRNRATDFRPFVLSVTLGLLLKMSVGHALGGSSAIASETASLELYFILYGAGLSPLL